MFSVNLRTMRLVWRCYYEFEVCCSLPIAFGQRLMERGWLLESAPHLVEDAVKYIIFLVDANALFDLALGMYDFSLVLMIAQHAQKVADSALAVKKKKKHQDADCL